MNKKALLFTAAAAMFALSGCASVSTARIQKMNDIGHDEQTKINAYGGYKAVVLGPVFFKQDGQCSEVDYLKFVNSKMPEAKDVYRVRMEFHSEKNGMVEKQYCKYSGLAINYVEMPVEEAAKWNAAYDAKAAAALDSKASVFKLEGAAKIESVDAQPAQPVEYAQPVEE